jgi:hypothetical protein
MGFFQLIFAGIVFVVMLSVGSFLIMPIISLIVSIVFAVMPIILFGIGVLIIIGLIGAMFK